MIETDYRQTLESAKRLLEHVLRSGTWVAASEVHAAATAHQISRSTLQRARTMLPITVQKQGTRWWWQLDIPLERRPSSHRSLRDSLGLPPLPGTVPADPPTSDAEVSTETPRSASLADHLASLAKNQIH